MPAAPWSASLRPFRPILYLATVALIVTVLARAQPVVVPLAVAVMLSFILTPPVAALERWGIPRLASVLVVVALAIGCIGGFAFVVSRQVSDLAANMPQYSTSIRAKLATLRAATEKSPITDIQATMDRVSHELDAQERKTGTGGAAPVPLAARRDLVPVTVVPDEPTDLERLGAIVEPVVAPMTHVGVVLILIIFMLVDREDLRDRLIRVSGPANVTLTTRAMDEAGQRIGRFLFTQSVVNVAFGAVVTLGLLAIGIPYAVLWGVVASLLRFVPYLGAALAMLMPAALAFVQSQGWAPTLETIGLFVGLDVVTANVVEPTVIGTHTGVSSLALLISALFWTWLWGPIGLLLSTPLIVCLAVVGKHVPGLGMLAVVLGDEPPLETNVSFYQRLLAGDDNEAEQIVDQQLATRPRTEVFDGIIVPTLIVASRDRLRDEISEVEYQNVLSTTAAIVRNGAEAPKTPAESNDERPTPRKILGVPARNAADEVLLEMLSQALTLDGGWSIDQLSTTALASEVVDAVEHGAPDVVWIASTPPGGLAHARYLAKRVRQRCPDAKICVFRPGENGTTLAGESVDVLAGQFATVHEHLPKLLLVASTTSSTSPAPPTALP